MRSRDACRQRLEPDTGSKDQGNGTMLQVAAAASRELGR